MKTIPLLVMVVLSMLLPARAEWLLVTQTTTLGGAVCYAGDVEKVIREEAGVWVLNNPTGLDLRLPKAAGKIVSDSEAVEALMKHVQRLYATIVKLEAERDALAGARTAQAPLPPGQRKARGSGTQTVDEANRWWQAEQQRSELERIRKSIDNLPNR